MTSPRAVLIADTAVALLAERGLRGLTHRAVDEAAGLPPGSTSNLARTRAVLLTLTLERVAGVDADPLRPLRPLQTVSASLTRQAARELLVNLLAEDLQVRLAAGRDLTLARLELALEANRDQTLRARYDELGGGFREFAAALLSAAGSPDGERRALYLMAWCDGVLFHTAAGAGRTHPPTREELREQVELMIRTLIDP
ncbi:TetR/AcrR family transcriptional regulator [Kitasatospora sp. NPDC096077]|uniref:TetR/AcrR family transcriptional regulator n=1 Tax=Kitasatospora sp. NPDC096077 TaxID=3155544 RepID=UPI00332FA362